MLRFKHFSDIHYNIEFYFLQTLDKSDTFTAEIQVSFLSNQWLPCIPIHSQDSSWQACTVSLVLDDDRIIKKVIELDHIKIFKSLYSIPTQSFPKQSSAHHWRIQISYSGKIQRQLFQGVYFSHHEDMIITQFAPIDARRAFPCFDHPRAKARFSISITCPVQYQCFSNTIHTNINPHDLIDLNSWHLTNIDPIACQTWIFPPTIPLSTYLIAFCIGSFTILSNQTAPIFTPFLKSDLENCRNDSLWIPDNFHGRNSQLFKKPPLEKDPLNISSTFSKSSKITNSKVVRIICNTFLSIKKMRIMLLVCCKAIEFLEFLFDFQLAGDKVDIVPTQVSDCSAMENMGLIISLFHKVEFPNSLDIFDLLPNHKFFSSARTLCHEIVHHFFSNIATQSQWCDTYLNEGLARFLEFHIVDAIFPQIKIGLQFFEVFQKSFAVDRFPTSSPSLKFSLDPVDPESSIQSSYNPIVYNKGALFFNLCYHTLGPKRFYSRLSLWVKQNYLSGFTSESFTKLVCQNIGPYSPPSYFLKQLDLFIIQKGVTLITIGPLFFDNFFNSSSLGKSKTFSFSFNSPTCVNNSESLSTQMSTSMSTSMSTQLNKLFSDTEIIPPAKSLKSNHSPTSSDQETFFPMTYQPNLSIFYPLDYVSHHSHNCMITISQNIWNYQVLQKSCIPDHILTNCFDLITFWVVSAVSLVSNSSKSFQSFSQPQYFVTLPKINSIVAFQAKQNTLIKFQSLRPLKIQKDKLFPNNKLYVSPRYFIIRKACYALFDVSFDSFPALSSYPYLNLEEKPNSLSTNLENSSNTEHPVSTLKSSTKRPFPFDPLTTASSLYHTSFDLYNLLISDASLQRVENWLELIFLHRNASIYVELKDYFLLWTELSSQFRQLAIWVDLSKYLTLFSKYFQYVYNSFSSSNENAGISFQNLVNSMLEPLSDTIPTPKQIVKVLVMEIKSFIASSTEPLQIHTYFHSTYLKNRRIVGKCISQNVEEIFPTLLNAFRCAKHKYHKTNFIFSLCQTRDSSNIKLLLSIATEKFKINDRFFILILGYVAKASPLGKLLAWEWIEIHWNAICKSNPSTFFLSSILSPVLSSKLVVSNLHGRISNFLKMMSPSFFNQISITINKYLPEMLVAEHFRNESDLFLQNWLNKNFHRIVDSFKDQDL